MCSVVFLLQLLSDMHTFLTKVRISVIISQVSTDPIKEERCTVISPNNRYPELLQ